MFHMFLYCQEPNVIDQSRIFQHFLTQHQMELKVKNKQNILEFPQNYQIKNECSSAILITCKPFVVLRQQFQQTQECVINIACSQAMERLPIFPLVLHLKSLLFASDLLYACEDFTDTLHLVFVHAQQAHHQRDKAQFTYMLQLK